MKLSSPIELIGKSVNLFFERKNLINFIKIYLPLVPFTIFSMLVTDYHDKSSTVWNLVYVGYLFVFLVIYFWIYAAGLISVKKVIDSKEIEIKAIYSKAWKVFGNLCLLSGLVVLIVVGGSLLLIVPGILFWVWYSFSNYILIDKELSVIESLKASKKLVEGRFWPVFGRSLVFVIFTVLVQMLFTLIPFRVGSFVLPPFGALFALPYFLLYRELSE